MAEHGEKWWTMGTWQNMGQHGETFGNIGENGEISTLQNAWYPGLVFFKS